MHKCEEVCEKEKVGVWECFGPEVKHPNGLVIKVLKWIIDWDFGKKKSKLSEIEAQIHRVKALFLVDKMVNEGKWVNSDANTSHAKLANHDTGKQGLFLNYS